MEIKDAIHEIQTRPAVPLFPHVALALQMSKSAVYEAAKKGEIDVIRINRSVRAITAPLRKRLHMDTA
jgi:hypothetical protein